jgi:hypothetical protein
VRLHKFDISEQMAAALTSGLLIKRHGDAQSTAFKTREAALQTAADAYTETVAKAQRRSALGRANSKLGRLLGTPLTSLASCRWSTGSPSASGSEGSASSPIALFNLTIESKLRVPL